MLLQPSWAEREVEFQTRTLVPWVACKLPFFIRAELLKIHRRFPHPTAEVYALSACHDFCQILSHDLLRITGKKFEIYLMTDAKSMFDTITKRSTVSEKRLLLIFHRFVNHAVLGKFKISVMFYTSISSWFIYKTSEIWKLKKVMEKRNLSHPINLGIIHY